MTPISGASLVIWLLHMRARELSAILAGAVLVLAPSIASADAQVNAGLTVGGGVAEMRDRPHAAFHLGLHGDVLFLRNRNSDMAIGPYVEASTYGFATAELGGGVSWLVPVSSSLPFIFSAGTFARNEHADGWEPGAAATIFFGSRSYNFHSTYGLMAGLFLQGRVGLANSRQADLLLGAHIDLSLLAWPWVYAFQAITR